MDPPEGSERDRELQKNVKVLRDLVKRVISQRREGGGEEYVPFIDNLLQSGVPDEQVRRDQTKWGCQFVAKYLYTVLALALPRLLMKHSFSWWLVSTQLPTSFCGCCGTWRTTLTCRRGYWRRWRGRPGERVGTD